MVRKLFLFSAAGFLQSNLPRTCKFIMHSGRSDGIELITNRHFLWARPIHLAKPNVLALFIFEMLFFVHVFPH